MSKKIIMLSSQQGSENGIFVKTYFKGENYIISDELYNVFKKLGWCKDFVETDIEEPVIEKKKIEIAPENKMANNPKNKRANNPKNKRDIK